MLCLISTKHIGYNLDLLRHVWNSTSGLCHCTWLQPGPVLSVLKMGSGEHNQQGISGMISENFTVKTNSLKKGDSIEPVENGHVAK